MEKITNYVLLNKSDCIEVALCYQFLQNQHLELFALKNSWTVILGISNRSGPVQAKYFSAFRLSAYCSVTPAVGDK